MVLVKSTCNWKINNLHRKFENPWKFSFIIANNSTHYSYFFLVYHKVYTFELNTKASQSNNKKCAEWFKIVDSLIFTQLHPSKHVLYVNYLQIIRNIAQSFKWKSYSAYLNLAQSIHYEQDVYYIVKSSLNCELHFFLSFIHTVKKK